MACQAGLFMAEPMLSRKVKARSDQGRDMSESKVRTARMPRVGRIHACQKIRRRRRSKMSAVAPARRPRMRTGRLAAVCMRAMSRGDAVRDVMSQVPAVSCIQVPTEETVLAIQRSRTSGMCSGAKGERTGKVPETAWGAVVVVAGPSLGDSKGIAGSSLPGGLRRRWRAAFGKYFG